MLTDFLLQVFVLIFWVAGFYWIYRVINVATAIYARINMVDI